MMDQPGLFMRPRVFGRPRRAGFTLLEVLVAVAVTAMIMSVVYSTFAQTVKSKEYVEAGNEAYHKARWALDKIAYDLASAFVHKSSNSNSLFYALSHEVNGMPMDELHFTSFSHVQHNPMLPGSDQCEISYKIAWVSESERFQLWRREDATIDEKNMEGGEELMLVDDIVAFNLRFWDGFTWQDQWDSRPLDAFLFQGGIPREAEFEPTEEMVKATPAAAEITIAVAGPGARPVIFTSKVKIEMSTIYLKALDEEEDGESSGGTADQGSSNNKSGGSRGGFIGAG